MRIFLLVDCGERRNSNWVTEKTSTSDLREDGARVLPIGPIDRPRITLADQPPTHPSVHRVHHFTTVCSNRNTINGRIAHPLVFVHCGSLVRSFVRSSRSACLWIESPTKTLENARPIACRRRKWPCRGAGGRITERRAESGCSRRCARTQKRRSGGRRAIDRVSKVLFDCFCSRITPAARRTNPTVNTQAGARAVHDQNAGSSYDSRTQHKWPSNCPPISRRVDATERREATRIPLK